MLWIEGFYVIKININSLVLDLNGIRLMELLRMIIVFEDVDVDVFMNNVIVLLIIILCMYLNSFEDFWLVFENRKLVIFEGFDFGLCLIKWIL